MPGFGLPFFRSRSSPLSRSPHSRRRPLWCPLRSPGTTGGPRRSPQRASMDTHTDVTDVYVVVTDTGIDFTNPDLQGNLDSADSRTCMNNSCSPGGADDFGHGTHCAGTIGAVANNGVGIAGLNWQVKLISCKFLGSNGSGYTSDAVLCFQNVKALKQGGLNIRLTSNSWGGGGFIQELKNAMSDVEALGVVNVCAAGNSGRNAAASPT